MSTDESFIDDTFGDAFLEIRASRSEWLFHNARAGPSDGNWDVASSTGSYVDDGCPTIHASRARPIARQCAPLAVEGLAKKLLQATIEDKRAEASGKDQDEKRSSSEKQSAHSATRDSIKTKPFVVPPLRRGPGLPPVLDQQRQSRPVENSSRTKVLDPQQYMYSKSKARATASRSGVQKAASDVASAARPTNQKVRILGKHGEKVDVELPKSYLLPQSTHRQSKSGGSKAASRPNGPGKGSPHADAPTGKQNSHTELQEAKQQPVAVSATRNTPSSHHSSRSKYDMLISSGLPKSFHSHSVAHQAASSSWKDSGVAKSGSSNANSRTGSVFSPSVLDVANSIAKMSPSQQTGFEEVGIGVTTGFPVQQKTSRQGSVAAAAAQKPDSRQSARSRSVAHVPADQQERKGGSWSNYRPPTVESASNSSGMMHSFGGFLPHNPPVEGVLQPDRCQSGERSVPSSRASIRSDTGLRLHDPRTTPNEYGKSTPNAAKRPDSKSTFRKSDAAPPDRDLHRYRSKSSRRVESWTHRSPQSPRRSTYAPKQTNFAGTGWISPHPLSVTSSEANAPPQPTVWVSNDDFSQKQRLTHEEWQLQRNEAGSKSSSFYGSRVPSAVGFHDISPAAYSHPPPPGYVGSYRDVTGKPPQPMSQAWGALASRDQPDPWEPTGGSVVRSQRSRKTQSSNRSLARSPSAAQQFAHCALPSQFCGSGSPKESSHAFGLTPTALENYQQRLGDTISHYSSQLSDVQQVQASQQPDYSMWNRSQSHASTRKSSRLLANSPARSNFRSSQASSLPLDSWDLSSNGTASTLAHVGLSPLQPDGWSPSRPT